MVVKPKKLEEIDVLETRCFQWQNELYRKDHFLKTFVEKLLGIKTKAVYVSGSPVFPDKNKLELTACSIIIFHENGHIMQFDNSEWLSIQLY